MNTRQDKPAALSPYLSPAAAWALAVGTSIGWGSLVVTNNDYLSQAGPLGTILGLLIGAALMLLVSRNYHYMANRYPEAGGIYAYTKHVFGYDRAFLVSWFLSLTYISMFWANATSLPLFIRYFIGDTFRFGYLFSVFGYEVYIGEAIVTLTAIFAATLLCIKSKNAAAHVMVVLVCALVVGITACFGVAIAKHGRSGYSFEPLFFPEGNRLFQVVRIAFISPWAFIGFEGITHSVEEFKFKTDRLHKILVISIVTTTLLYIFVVLLSVTAYPADCENWLDYIRNLGKYQGIAGLPAFYAADHYLGQPGIIMLMVTLLALILTSLIGNLRALSRLFYAVARDGILPERYTHLNDKQIPSEAMKLVAVLSVLVPFLGRTAIGWIVDITTLGATLIYGFVSAATFKVARRQGDRREQLTGGLGFAIMLVFGVYLLFPNLFADETLATETYILIIFWSIFGFFFFRRIIAKDHARRFGKAIIVWISLLALVVLMAMIWSGRTDEAATESAIQAVQSYYNGTADAAVLAMDEASFIDGQILRLHINNVFNSMLVISMFALALGAMLINHFSMRKWEAITAQERDMARAAAYRDPLTGVKSKNAFVEHEERVNRQLDDGELTAFGVIVCDVNGLKHINDTQGHKAGDAYIQAACRLICNCFKHSPIFRVGGDEFVIHLQGQDYENRQTILDATNRIIEGNVGSRDVVISLGMAVFDPDADTTYHDVFSRADGLMYERKKALKAMGAVTRD